MYSRIHHTALRYHIFPRTRQYCEYQNAESKKGRPDLPSPIQICTVSKPSMVQRYCGRLDSIQTASTPFLISQLIDNACATRDLTYPTPLHERKEKQRKRKRKQTPIFDEFVQPRRSSTIQFNSVNPVQLPRSFFNPPGLSLTVTSLSLSARFTCRRVFCIPASLSRPLVLRTTELPCEARRSRRTTQHNGGGGGRGVCDPCAFHRPLNMVKVITL